MLLKKLKQNLVICLITCICLVTGTVYADLADATFNSGYPLSQLDYIDSFKVEPIVGSNLKANREFKIGAAAFSDDTSSGKAVKTISDSNGLITGLDFIAVPKGFKETTANKTFIEFVVNQQVTVYIGTVKNDGPTDWLNTTNGWKKESVTFTLGDGASFEVQSQTFEAGSTVALGRPRAKAYYPYVIMLDNGASRDNSLQDISAYGATIPGFSPETLEYDVKLDCDTDVKDLAGILAAKNNDSDAEEPVWTMPESLPGIATISVKSEKGVVRKYTLNLSVLPEFEIVSGPSFSADTIEKDTSIKGSVSIVNNKGTETKAAIIMVLYSDEGTYMEDVRIFPQTLPAKQKGVAGVPVELPLEMPIPNEDKDFSVKLYVVDNYTQMNWYCDAKTLK